MFISWFSLFFHIYSCCTLIPQKPLSIRLHAYPGRLQFLYWHISLSYRRRQCSDVNVHKGHIAGSDVHQFSLSAVTTSRFTVTLFSFLFYLIIYRFFSRYEVLVYAFLLFLNLLRWPRNTLYQQKLALTSPTSGGPSVGTVRNATEFS
jgi:hypothetical protein